MMHHKLALSVVLVFLIIVLGIALWISMQNTPKEEPVACTMDARMCPDGSYVGRSGPNCEFTQCPTPTQDDIQTHIDSKKDFIVVTSPTRDTAVDSPLVVTGLARGTWYFEASFPIVVVDWDGLIIGEGYAEAQSDWMTEDFVPFKGTVSFTVPENTPYRRGAIIFKKDNPSGEPERDDALEIPVTF